MLSLLGKNVSRQHFDFFFFFIPENKVWHFMQSVSRMGSIFHANYLLKKKFVRNVNLIFLKKKKKKYCQFIFNWICTASVNPCPAEYIKMPRPLLIFSQRDNNPDYCSKFTYLMGNSADPDQLASEEANWSGSTLFAKAGCIWVQQN